MHDNNCELEICKICGCPEKAKQEKDLQDILDKIREYGEGGPLG